jgi:hypothetical protein
VAHSDRGRWLAFSGAETNLKPLPLTRLDRCAERDGGRNLAATSAEAESGTAGFQSGLGAVAESSRRVGQWR